MSRSNEFTYKGRGVNKFGNQWDSRDYGTGGNPYHYSNKDGSWYYKNPNGSRYFDNGQGRAVYTDPNGDKYYKDRRGDEQHNDANNVGRGSGRTASYADSSQNDGSTYSRGSSVHGQGYSTDFYYGNVPSSSGRATSYADSSRNDDRTDNRDLGGNYGSSAHGHGYSTDFYYGYSPSSNGRSDQARNGPSENYGSLNTSGTSLRYSGSDSSIVPTGHLEAVEEMGRYGRHDTGGHHRDEGIQSPDSDDLVDAINGLELDHGRDEEDGSSDDDSGSSGSDDYDDHDEYDDQDDYDDYDDDDDDDDYY